jgi:PAS domain S-box-containing protein
MNEELQSTTEELETSREELQSMNEELHTVNQELKTKVEELTRANADLSNLIASTVIATLFLDRNLRVSRYTPAAADLFNLIPGDLGRPFDHVTHRLAHDGLTELAQRVLDTLHVEEEEVQDDDGRWYVLRATPYRTADDRIEGVVMTVVDVTAQKRAQAEALRRATQQEAVAELGQLALRTGSLEGVFERAVSLAADALEADFAKVLRHDPEAGVLHLVAGVGWAGGLVGTVTVPDDQSSQAGYTLLSDRPVVVPDLEEESRFTAPPLLSDHGVRSGISVTIPGAGGQPFGVFGIHGRAVRQFSDKDTQFVDALASVVGAAIRRARNEETIRHQLGEIEAIYATAPVGLAVLDRDLRYRRINERLAAINGRSVEGHLGKSLSEVVPEIAPDLAPRLRRVIETGEALEDLEVHGVTPGSEGEERTWLTTYVPRFDGEGGVVGLSLMVRDVTERRRQEAELAEANRLLELAMSGGGLGGYTIEFGDGEPVVYFDEQAQTLLEAPPSAPRRAMNARLHPDDLEAARAKVDQACDPDVDGDTFSAEFRYTRKDGKTLWLAARGVCTFHEGAARRIVGLLFDVTDLKEAEARVRRQLAEVDAYFDAVPLAVAVYDAEGRYLRVNRQLAEFVGLPPDELTGHRTGDLFPDHGDTNEPFLHRVLRTGVPIRDVEMTLPRPAEPDGALYEWLVHYVPLLEDGAVVGAMVVIQDVTALKRAQAGLERLTDELEARVVMRTAEVRRLVGDLTEAERRERGRVAQVLHDDLQQLLYAVQFKLEAMRRHAEAELLDVIEQADGLVARAVQVTRTLTVDLRPPVLRGEGLDSTFEWLGHRMGEAYGLEIAVEREGPVQAGKTVQVLLFQIVRELLFNVVKHAGTAEATIRVGPAEGGGVRVVVSDEGVGFELDNADDEATGAGLVSVRERIRLVGGSVHVRSAPDSGTEIEIVCPTELYGPSGGSGHAATERRPTRASRRFGSRAHAVRLPGWHNARGAPCSPPSSRHPPRWRRGRTPRSRR